MFLIRPLSPHQRQSLEEATKRINIWCGSVRSGKSFVALLAFLNHCLKGPEGLCAIIGRSERTIKQNIITLLYDLCGNDIQYKSGEGELNIYGRKVLTIGAADARAEGRILGATYAGALVDEATLIPENVWRTLLDRLTHPDSKCFATTNPDSPYHWLKTEFIDKQNELDLIHWDFHLEDNPSLHESYIANIKKENTGIWYKRKIEGIWTQAQGAIFSMFDQSRHVIDLPPGLAREYYIGIDYGTSAPCAFVLVGYDPNIFPNLWVEKEYYWDSKKQGRQKTNSQYVDDLIAFIGDYYIEAIYVDPSAAALKAEIRQRHSSLSVRDADNDVLEGLQLHMQMLSNGTVKICKSCINLIGEYTSYVWDETAQRRGEDKPMKAFDHLQDSLRYCLYTRFKHGIYPIKREAPPPQKAWDPMGEFLQPSQGSVYGFR